VLTYDSLIDFFSIRYEIRVGENDSEVLAAQYASSEAELVLNTMGFGYRNLRTTVSDMADVWGQRGATTLQCRSRASRRDRFIRHGS
jgi:hypothetical protein